MRDTLKAKVFISCGQNQNSDEVTIANQVKERLSQKGFEPYVATQQQSLKGLKENIFDELSSSEYFVFIDFKREQLGSTDAHRGSLFSHQELAIASFLDMPVIAFQERGIKQGDGILGFLQANCTPFSDRNTLANVVADKVDQAGWNPNWKNQLEMEVRPTPFEDAQSPEGTARFFHIRISNLNPYRHARNCYGFLEEVQDLATGGAVHRVETIELKWKGYVLPFATILPSSFRDLDGFHVYHTTPAIAHFNMYADYGRLVIPLNGPGDFRLTYLVVSDNFKPVSSTFRLHIDTTLERITFVQDDPNGGERLETDSVNPENLLRGTSNTTAGPIYVTGMAQPPIATFGRIVPPSEPRANDAQDAELNNNTSDTQR